MASLAAYSITLGATDYPVKYAGLLSYVEPYLINLETFTFSGGNVGLGVTPSAWQASWKVLQASRDAMFGGTDGGAVYGFMSVNAYADGTAAPNTATWRYKLTGSLASKYEQTSGMHQWFTAGTGTAGNEISFTQAMTLDASGNLSCIRAFTSGNSTFAGSLNAQGGGSGATISITPDTINGSNGVVYNTSFVTGGVGPHIFQTGGTERARITSGGDLLVGATSNTPANTTAVAFCAGSTTGYGSTWQQIPNNAPASYKAFTVFRGNVEIGSISYNGTGVNFNATSDRRLKENIAPAGNAGAVIDAINIVQHDWKAGGHTRFGVIAQDLNEVAPEAVTAGDDNEEIERTWGVDFAKLVPMLIKEIQSLRARVAALEAA